MAVIYNMATTLPEETLQESDAFADDYLIKAGLSELNEKLRALSAGQ